MYRALLTAISASALLFLASCREPVIKGSGEVKTEQRQVPGDFNAIESELSLDADIQVVPGSKPSIELKGYGNILSHIKLEMEGKTLKIKTTEDVHLFMDENIKATIIVPELTALGFVGDSKVQVTGTVTGNSFKVETAGSGRVNVDSVRVGTFEVSIAGSGDVAVKGGAVTKGAYEIAGAGSVLAQELNHTDANIEIAGAGDVALTATQKLDISIAGSGDVTYKGHPTITKDIAGSGDVTDAN